MEFKKTAIDGVYLITPRVFTDERGFFLERYNKQLFAENGIDVDFVQDNHSQSQKNVLRGLHFQSPPKAQDKLVWVTRGSVYDVVVDIRKDSSTYGTWVGYELSEENKQMLFVPKGCAHGFVTLSDRADLQYKVSDTYSPEHDGGIIWNDPTLAIDWHVAKPLLSEKDAALPTFDLVSSPF